MEENCKNPVEMESGGGYLWTCRTCNDVHTVQVMPFHFHKHPPSSYPAEAHPPEPLDENSDPSSFNTKLAELAKKLKKTIASKIRSLQTDKFDTVDPLVIVAPTAPGREGNESGSAEAAAAPLVLPQHRQRRWSGSSNGSDQTIPTKSTEAERRKKNKEKKGRSASSSHDNRKEAKKTQHHSPVEKDPLELPTKEDRKKKRKEKGHKTSRKEGKRSSSKPSKSSSHNESKERSSQTVTKDDSSDPTPKTVKKQVSKKSCSGLRKLKEEIHQGREKAKQVQEAEERKMESKQLTKADGVKESKPLKKAEERKESQPLKKAEGVKESKPLKKAEGVKESKPLKKAEERKESQPLKKAEGVKESKPLKKAEELKESQPLKKAEELKESKQLNKAEELKVSDKRSQPQESAETKSSKKRKSSHGDRQGSSDSPIPTAKKPRKARKPKKISKLKKTFDRPPLIDADGDVTDKVMRLVEKMQRRMTAFPAEKEGPHVTKLLKSMLVTFAYRKYLYENGPDIKSLIEKFPALRLYQILKRDFELFKRANFEELAYKLDNLIEVDYELAKSKYYLWPEDFIQTASENYRKNPNDKLLRDIKMLVYAYEKMGGQLHGVLYKQREPEKTPFICVPPTIDVVGNLGTSSIKITVYCEGQEITEVPNFFEAVMSVYALYWIFNLCYDEQCKPFFETFDDLIGE